MAARNGDGTRRSRGGIGHGKEELLEAPVRVIFVVPYFGDLPVWLGLFLESCSHCPSFTWLLISDHMPGRSLPSNVYFEQMTLADFNRLARAKTGLAFELVLPYKVCDARPLFGLIFADYLVGYDFWGYTDLDIIYGDLESYFGDFTALANVDVFSAFDDRWLVGHFTLIRNVARLNRLPLAVPLIENLYAAGHPSEFFDEKPYKDVLDAQKSTRIMTVDYKRELQKARCFAGATILLEGQIYDEQPTGGESYYWREGKVYQRRGDRTREFLYLHFLKLKEPRHWRAFDARTPLDRVELTRSGVVTKSRRMSTRLAHRTAPSGSDPFCPPRVGMGY
jgi:hypothetical protein